MAMPILKYSSVKVTYEDNEIKTKFDTGRVVARKKFTKTRRNIVAKVVLTTSSLLNDLITHFDDVGTVKKFSFTNPDTNEVIQVRFSKPIEYTKTTQVQNRYAISDLELVEVI